MFSGVGKQAWEMRDALAAKVKCFNVESEAELHRLSEVAQHMGTRAPVSLRVNPDVDAQTHPYISTGLKENKFGIAIESALDVYRVAQSLPALDIVGLDCHIGSQLTDISPYFDALEKLLDLVDKLAEAGIRLNHLDLGGGLASAIRTRPRLRPRRCSTRSSNACRPAAWGTCTSCSNPAARWSQRRRAADHGPVPQARGSAQFRHRGRGHERPAAPGPVRAFHGVRPVHPRAGAQTVYDIVGPVCESADWLAKQRMLAIEQGDLLAVESAGAYSMAMASNYNARPRPAEVMVDGDKYYVVRRRETLDDLLKGESTCLSAGSELLPPEGVFFSWGGPAKKRPLGAFFL